MGNPDIGGASLNLKDGGLGARLGIGKLRVIAGCAEKGPILSLVQHSDSDAEFDIHGYGPGMEYAARDIKDTGLPHLFVRLTSATVGSLSSVDDDAVTGTSAVTASGTPLDDYEIQFEVTTGGTIATKGIVFQYSLDGGRRWSSKLALGTANSYLIPGTGVTLNFAAGTLVAGDVAYLYATGPRWDSAELTELFELLRNASHMVRSVTLVGPSTATQVGDLQDELDAYETGDRRYALGFASARMPYRPARWVKGAQTVTFADANPDTITRSAGSWILDGFKVGMLVTVDGSASNDGTYPITAVTATVLTVTGALAAEVATAAPEITAVETKTIYRDALRADFDDDEALRVAVGAGACYIPSALHPQRWSFRREFGWAASIRFGQFPIARSLGRRKNGPLTAVSINDANGNVVEWDSRLDTGLSSLDGSNGRFITARSYDNRAGCFVAVPSILHSPGSDFSRVHLRAVMDLCCEVSQKVAEEELQDDLVLNANGTIQEDDAKRIEKAARRQYELEILGEKFATDVTLILSRVDDLTAPGSKVRGKIRVVPLGYLEALEFDIGFVNPNLEEAA